MKSTSKYLRRNLVTLAASGKARKILSEPAFSGGDAENSLPVVRRPLDCSKCNGTRRRTAPIKMNTRVIPGTHARERENIRGGFRVGLKIFLRAGETSSVSLLSIRDFRQDSRGNSYIFSAIYFRLTNNDDAKEIRARARARKSRNFGTVRSRPVGERE